MGFHSCRMPQDKNGQNIKDGDIVSLKCRVVASSRSTGDATSNATLETVESMGGHRPRIAVNSKMVELDAPASNVNPATVEPVPGSTPKPVPNLESGVNENPESGDPRPGTLTGGVASPARGDNGGFREPSSSIGDGILTSNALVPDKTLPESERKPEAHGGPGDVVAKGEAEPIRRETDGREVNVRDISTPVNVRDDARPGTDSTAATESADAVNARTTTDVPREAVNTGDAIKDAAGKAQANGDNKSPDAGKDTDGDGKTSTAQASSPSVANQQDRTQGGGEAGDIIRGNDTTRKDGDEEGEGEDEGEDEDTVESLVANNSLEELKSLAEKEGTRKSGTKEEIATAIIEKRGKTE